MKSQKATAWRYHDSILAAKNLYFQGPVLGPEMGSKSQTRQGAQQSMCDVCVFSLLTKHSMLVPDMFSISKTTLVGEMQSKEPWLMLCYDS